MAGVVVAVSLETIALAAGTIPIPRELYHLSLAVGMCSFMAHLAACVCAELRSHQEMGVDRVEGRFDSYETNILNSGVDLLVGPHASPPRQCRTSPSPTPLRSVR